MQSPSSGVQHPMFAVQYNELALAMDHIAGARAVIWGPAARYAKLSSIKESEAVPAALDMIADFVNDSNL